MSNEIRLGPPSYIVLGLLEIAGEGTPYDLKQFVALTLGDFWTLPHAQLYTEPERLAEAGYLEVRQEEGGRHRKHYKVTDRGRQAMRDWLAEPTDEMAEMRDPAVLKLFFGASPKMLADVQLPAHESRLGATRKCRSWQSWPAVGRRKGCAWRSTSASPSSGRPWRSGRR